MSIPVIVTKLFIPPPRPSAVARPRLIARLDAGLHRKLTLVAAPAGFGKTTLVSVWVAEIARPTAWLSLDEGDSDLARFLAYLVAALQTIAPTIGAGMAAVLQSPQPPPAEAILTELLNAIITLPAPCILVLDDYHLIDSRPIDQALTFLLDHLPPQLHLVITTREDPQLPLARLRVRDQLAELRAADLRFTPAEAAAFLTEVMDLDLSAEHVTVLETRTEGWIAGLQLAALSLRGRTDVARFVEAFSGDNRYIVDYLADEVLQRQPERVRSFLLQTSILARLSGPLCDAVTGQNDSLALLDALERGNLFVVLLDDQRHWFRYHHLFADMLAAHVLQKQPAHVPILHQRASAWYASNGLPAEAIHHALAAADFGCAAGLVERAWPAMDGRFQAATWLGWVRALPDELVRPRPVLSVAYAWALLNAGELEAAEARLADAEQWLAAESGRGGAEGVAAMIIVDDAQFQNLPASIATAHAYLAQARGQLPATITYGRRALDLVPAADYLRRGPAAALLGLAQWASGDLEAAYRSLADAMIGFQKAGSLHFATSVTSGLADIRTVQGRLHEAVGCYAQAMRLARAQGEPPIRGMANLYVGLSELYHEQGQREVASEHLRRAEELGDQAGLPDWRYRLGLAQARFKESRGDLAGTLDLLDEAERHYRRTPVPDVRPLAALRARVWVAQGRPREARRWAQEQGLSSEDALSFLREFEHITLARVLIAEHMHAPAGSAMREAMRLLGRLQQAAEAGGRIGSVIAIGVVQALALQAQGDLAPALAALDRALRLAEPEGYIRIFAAEGPPMARLLGGLRAEGGRWKAYRQTLLATLNEQEAVQPSALSPQPLVEPLSERELEVLRLFRTELNGPDIARRLMLSLNTIRTHTKHIYTKLGVTNRRAAVQRAEDLDLF